MATSRTDESDQFKEPMSPTASNTETSSASTSTSGDSAKPSITGILKNVVHAPSSEEIVNDAPMENAIEQIGDDGQKRGT
ncbi:hypothetical protein DE146DRAFT_112293 [Phaeosphaeria sp. MPI-PUGE-AT-0046c]|nr:hypothetical protein DE146DRAFT_112293 [Phaeosphaeria sp. MPI-PUGE-AT-0046c]